MKRKIFKWLAWLAALGALCAATVIAALWIFVVPGLPAIDDLRDVRLQVPLRVYTADGELMDVFGEKRRSPLQIDDIPDQLIQAFIAAEDERFYRHPGVDYQGLMRAAINLARTGSRSVGGSTITMQLTRNIYLSFDRTYTRKLNEILLALKIERELSKEEILELYLNKIYLGHRAYGVGAAAEIYYGKQPNELTLAEAAMIAALPKAPSRINPITSPERALLRRNYVLRRMNEVGYINDIAMREAMAAPDIARRHELPIEVRAPYVSEMIRQQVFEQLGEEAYTGGYRAYSTIDADMQRAADKALRQQLMAYDRRHGYRGPESRVDLAQQAGPVELEQALAGLRSVAGLLPALVVESTDETAELYLAGGLRAQLGLDEVRWARPYISEDRRGPRPESVTDVLSRGDIVRLRPQETEKSDTDDTDEPNDEKPDTLVAMPLEPEISWQLSQLPKLQGALVAMDHHNGAIRALSGGFSFELSNFNRAVQAQRQPGSSFKPFLWSAAMENGMTPATLINDAPVVFDDPGLERSWRPGNYSGRFFGPTTLREALVASRNLVAIRVLQSIGASNGRRYMSRFGFPEHRMPNDLSLALGNMAATPLEVTSGYASFVNGGFLVEPRVLERLVDDRGNVLMLNEPPILCSTRDCQEVSHAENPAELNGQHWLGTAVIGGPGPEPKLSPVIDERNAYIIHSMLKDVITDGTGRGALRIGRRDIGGKTGTTNDQRDAWFAGFGGPLAVTTWVGFDDLGALGRGETGARAALPMWTDFMAAALDGLAEYHPPQPSRITTMRIDPTTGRPASAGDSGAVMELFFAENTPSRDDDDESEAPENPYDIF